VSPLVQFSTDVLFRNLCLRPAFQINRAMNKGLTKAQASEVMAQRAFYTGWSTTLTALPILEDVVDKWPNEVFRSKPYDKPAVT
jgi:Carboxymuconolactone decarboxylase family